MKDYTNSTPVFSETIKVLDVTDPGHADNVNVTTEQLLDNTLVLEKEKVDKVDGKGLSTNDYTDEEKEKLGSISVVNNTADKDKIVAGVAVDGGEASPASSLPRPVWITSSASGALTEKRTYSSDFTYVPSTHTLNVKNVNGTAASATNADTVDGKHASDLQNYNNLTNKPTIPAAVDGVNFNGKSEIVHYGVCNTEGEIAEKAVSLPGFTLTNGARITVWFKNENTATGHTTLNVNRTGAKEIIHEFTYANNFLIRQNGVYEFVYSGSYWMLVGHIVWVKGAAESSYRTGKVNLTAENVGALPISGGTMSDNSVIHINTIQNDNHMNMRLGADYIEYIRDDYGSTPYHHTKIDSDGIYLENEDGPDGVTISSYGSVNVWGYDNSRCYISPGSIEIKNVGTYGTDLVYYKGDGLHGVKTGINLVSTPIDAADSTRLRGVKVNSYYASASFCPYDSPTDLGSSTERWNNIYATSGTIQTSDRTKKTDIADLTDDKTKEFIMGLTPVSYKMTEGTSGRTHYGLIAQDVEDLMETLHIDSKDFAGFIKSPKVIRKETDEDGNPLKEPIEEVVEGEYDYSLRYDEFIAPLIKVVQCQQKDIEALREELAIIKAGIQQ